VRQRYISMFDIAKLRWAAAALMLGSCASIPPPLAEIARSDAAISAAQQANATDYAPLELGSAQQKLKHARAAMAAEDYITARRLAEQAEVEAQLAQAKSQSATAQQSLQQVRESIRVLREQLASDSAIDTATPKYNSILPYPATEERQ
jgi:hypothetical protein